MKRLGRWALNGLTAVSALLFVVVCVFWVRSCWAWDQAFWFGPDGQRVNVESGRGAIYVNWTREYSPATRNYWFTGTGHAWFPWEAQWNVNPSRWLAVRVFRPHLDDKGEEPSHVVIVSNWLIAS